MGGDVAHVLSLPRAQLDSFLGAVGVGLASKAAILQVLQQCKSLRVSTAHIPRVCITRRQRILHRILRAWVCMCLDWLWCWRCLRSPVQASLCGRAVVPLFAFVQRARAHCTNKPCAMPWA